MSIRTRKEFFVACQELAAGLPDDVAIELCVVGAARSTEKDIYLQPYYPDVLQRQAWRVGIGSYRTEANYHYAFEAFTRWLVEFNAQRAASQSKQAHPYGCCPVCHKPGMSRERRINGNDICQNGHTYPSSEAEVS